MTLSERLRDLAHACRLEWAPEEVNDVNEAADELDRFTARVAELEKDAERYRWLRQWPTHFADEVWGRYGAGLHIHKVYLNTPERLDAAIDAARRTE